MLVFKTCGNLEPQNGASPILQKEFGSITMGFSPMHLPSDYQIAFFTNTYLPFVGGVALSTQLYQRHLERLGAQVIVYAPAYDGADLDGEEVRRVPSIRHFYKSGFSLPLPVSFKPSDDFGDASFDIVHVHHPFLLGETGMSMARQYRIPLVFTYHTQYELYTHYVPISDEMARKTIIRHTREFCNSCDLVIAPTEDVKRILRQRDVTTPIEVLPTGIELERYKNVNCDALRNELKLGREDRLLVHVGRLAQEKNLAFLLRSCLRAMTAEPHLHLAIAGEGSFRPALETMVQEAGEAVGRVHFLGSRTGSALLEVYCGGDLFVFASQTETQGMVIAEAMGGGMPAIALDADGVRHLVCDEINGRLLPASAGEDDFAQAILAAVANPERLRAWSKVVRRMARKLDMPVLAEKLLEIYRELKMIPNRQLKTETMSFGLMRNYFETVWEQVENWISRI